MPSLAEMLKKNQAAVTTQESNGNGLVDSQLGGPVPDSPKESVDVEPVVAPVESGSLPSSNEAPAPLGKLKLGGLKLGGLKLKPAGTEAGPTNTNAGSGSSTNAGGTPEGNAARLSDSSAIPGNGNANNPATPASGGLSLIGIAGLNTDSGKLNRIEEDGEGYLDQVPAQAPARELPTDMSKQMESFVKSLDAIYTLHSEPDLFVDMVSKIMSDMSDYPPLKALLADEDSNAMIRGLRQSAGMAQVKKQTAKATRGKKVTANSAKLDNAMATLQGLAGFDLSGE